MEYELESTDEFETWLRSLRDKKMRYRLEARMKRITQGSFGDFKRIAPQLFELRCFFGGGFRVYYTLRGQAVILLLCGGTKATQKKDILQAKRYLNSL